MQKLLPAIAIIQISKMIFKNIEDRVVAVFPKNNENLLDGFRYDAKSSAQLIDIDDLDNLHFAKYNCESLNIYRISMVLQFLTMALNSINSVTFRNYQGEKIVYPLIFRSVSYKKRKGNNVFDLSVKVTLKMIDDFIIDEGKIQEQYMRINANIIRKDQLSISVDHNEFAKNISAQDRSHLNALDMSEIESLINYSVYNCLDLEALKESIGEVLIDSCILTDNKDKILKDKYMFIFPNEPWKDLTINIEVGNKLNMLSEGFTKEEKEKIKDALIKELNKR